jgi:glutaredoxin
MEFGGDASYPQIQIDNQHIGTMKEALHYMSKKEMLDKQRHTM